MSAFHGDIEGNVVGRAGVEPATYGLKGRCTQWVFMSGFAARASLLVARASRVNQAIGGAP